LIQPHTFLLCVHKSTTPFKAFPELFTNTTFHIETIDKLDKTSRAFCLESSKKTEGATLNMRPCVENFLKQIWFMDTFGQLRLKANAFQCIIWGEGLKLSPHCRSDHYPAFNGAKTYQFNYIQVAHEAHEIKAVKKNSHKIYLGIDGNHRVALFNSRKDQHLSKWRLKWVVYESLEPSEEPTSNPTAIPSSLPTTAPSTSPIAMPSHSPTISPSLSPSECVDEEGWTVGGMSKYQGLHCTQISTDSEKWCIAIMAESDTATFGKTINEACCVCNGSTFKTTFPSLVPSSPPSASPAPTIEPIPSSSPTDCEDEPDWYFNPNQHLGCKSIVDDPVDMCNRWKDHDYNGKTITDACCICNGGTHKSRMPSVEPSSSQTPSASPTASVEPTLLPSALPSTTPSQSMLPSNFPSVTSGTVLDIESCRHNEDCKSKVCSDYSFVSGLGLCAPGVSITSSPSTKVDLIEL